MLTDAFNDLLKQYPLAKKAYLEQLEIDAVSRMGIADTAAIKKYSDNLQKILEKIERNCKGADRDTKDTAMALHIITSGNPYFYLLDVERLKTEYSPFIHQMVLVHMNLNGVSLSTQQLKTAGLRN